MSDEGKPLVEEMGERPPPPERPRARDYLEGFLNPPPAGHAGQPGGEVYEGVIAALREIYDPEIPVNIFELGLIYAIEIEDDGAVKIEMTLTAPGCPSAQELPVMVHDAVMAVPGVSSCTVDTVWDPPWDPSRMSDEARLSLNMF